MSDEPSAPTATDVAAEPGARTRRAAGNAAALAVAEVVGKGATFVLAIVAARLLTKDDYGAIAYGLSLGTLLTVFASWGFDTIMQQEGSVDVGRLPKLLAETLVWRSILAVLFGTAGVVIGFGRSSTASMGLAVAIIVVSCFADTYFDAIRSVATAYRRLGRVSVALVVNRVATAVLGIGLLAIGLGVVAFAAAYFVGSVLALGFGWAAVRKLGVRADFTDVDRAALWSLFKRSSPMAVSMVISNALFRMDTIIVQAKLGDAAVADYAVAYKLFETGLFVSWSINKAVFPEMCASRDDPPKVRHMAERTIGLLTAVYAPVAVILIVRGGDVIALLFGQQYVESSTPALRLLALAPLAFGLSYVTGSVLIAYERFMPTVWVSLAALCFNVAANLTMVPVHGIAAAAAINTGSYALEGLLMFLCCVPIVRWIRVDRAMAAPVFAAAGLAAVCWLWMGPVLMVAAAGMALYAVVWFCLARTLDPAVAEVVTHVSTHTLARVLRRST